VLVVVLAHDPDVRLLDRPGNNVAGEAFSQVPYLVAIVGLPFCNFLDYPAVIFPIARESAWEIGDERKRALTAAFRFWIGVDWHRALPWYREMRNDMKADGSWPGWEVVRFGKGRGGS